MLIPSYRLQGILRLSAPIVKWSAPTLVVSGERDSMVPHELKESLVFGIPNAKIEIVNDSGHATPIDSPDTFNRVLLNFLHEVDDLTV